jgi:hypothetical protein
MRAFYRVPLAAWPDPVAPSDGLAAVTMPQRPGDCIECGRTAKSAYVLAPSDPYPALDALKGAVRLGARLSELTATDAKWFTRTPVQVPLTGPDGAKGVTEAFKPSSKVTATDVVCGPPIMAALFAGDDPADLT